MVATMSSVLVTVLKPGAVTVCVCVYVICLLSIT